MTAFRSLTTTSLAGQAIDLPEWKALASATIVVGQPARIVLLKPASEPGKFVVETVLR